MAVNATKQAREKYTAALKDLESRNTALLAAPNDAAAKTAFESQLAVVDGLKSEYARLADYEKRMAEGLIDADVQNPERKSAAELASMTEFEKRSDKVNPLLNPDAKGYRLSRAMQAMGSGAQLTGVELEVAQELQKRNTAAGIETDPGKLRIPFTLHCRRQGATLTQQLASQAGLSDLESRALTAAVSTGAIPTILDTTVIEMLRNQVVLTAAGAQMLSGVVGNFDMPKQSAQPTVTIGGESIAASESAAAIASKVSFTPKTITGNSKVTRRFLKMAEQSVDGENFIRLMIINQIAIGVDFEGINGPGTANRCTGIMQNGSVGTTALGTNGAAITFAKLVDMETAVADANAGGMGRLCYISNAKGRGSMKQTLKAAASGSEMIWTGSIVNGYDALMSNQIPKNLTKGSGTNLSAVLFGDFSHAIFAMWSGIDVVVDPFTGGSEGATSVYCHQDFDFQLRYAEAFNKIVDMIA